MTGDVQSDLDRQGIRLRSYSRAVRLLKYVLPVMAVLLILTIFAVGQDRGSDLEATTLLDAATLNAGLGLKDPRIAGITDDGDPYVITARRAIPDGAMPDVIALEAPVGELQLPDDLEVDIRSDTGEMIRSRNVLNLDGNVVLTTSNGYVVTGPRLEMNLEAKFAVVPNKVAAEGPRGRIDAKSMTVRQGPGGRKDTVVRFDGAVKVVFLPENGKD